MAYQPIPDNNFAAPLVVAIVPQQLVGPSFGITTTPNPGWDCCNLPPCVCCVRPIYFSDNHKTWGETGQIVLPCCGCSNWNITNAKVSPGGMAYDFQYTKPCCDDGMIVVSRGGIEVGRLLTHTFCCPCDKTVINAIDTQGKSRWTLRVPPFSCCGDGCGCGRCRFICCSGRPCCETWSRWDNLFLSGPEGAPMHPHHVRASLQYNNCCPNLYPKWFGYDAPPAATEDDRALLLGFLFLHQIYPHQFQFQIPQFSALPPTLGAMLN